MPTDKGEDEKKERLFSEGTSLLKAAGPVGGVVVSPTELPPRELQPISHHHSYDDPEHLHEHRHHGQYYQNIEEDSNWKLKSETFTSCYKSEDQIEREVERIIDSKKERPGYFERKEIREKITRFYEKQNKVIECIDDAITGKIYEEEEEGGAMFAINLSLFINVLLFAVKLYASYVSGSLSVVSSAVDSFLDLFSGTILWFTTRDRIADVLEYPAGKKNRMEPLGVIIFSAVMGTAVLQLVSQAGEDLYFGFTVEEPERIQPKISYISILVGVVVTKFILWIICRNVAKKQRSAAVEALAQDHFNDVFTNTFTITTALLGSFLMWWFDPLGAAIMGIYITIFWARSGYEQVKVLSGFRASKKFRKQLIVVAWNHHEKVLHIDTVRPFHFGSDLIVEVDIILPVEMKLREAHDIAEALQINYEKLPSVARSYVHIDYEYTHRPEHKIPDNEPFLKAASRANSMVTPTHEV